MRNLNRRLEKLIDLARNGEKIRIAILGLGSVGHYLLDYLVAWPDQELEIYVAGRDREKIEKDVNIIRVANVIKYNRSKTIHLRLLDLENLDSLAEFFYEVQPHFAINTSRVYSGLKYGSISWPKIRAYGLWCPLSIRYIRNIMLGVQQAGVDPMVINTSYSDAVIAWLKSAGLAYPDFGSGNLNHLIPRIKFAAAAQLKADCLEDLEVVLATSHYHDVVISKEGHDDGCPPLLHINFKGKQAKIDLPSLWQACALAMPTDAKRNMMNAASNFEIITKTLMALKNGRRALIHIPGIDGEIGGYPINLDFQPGSVAAATFNEDYFTLDEMRAANRHSIYLEGIEKVEDGALFYTDELLAKVKSEFKSEVPKKIPYTDIDLVSSQIIREIIKPVS